MKVPTREDPYENTMIPIRVQKVGLKKKVQVIKDVDTDQFFHGKLKHV